MSKPEPFVVSSKKSKSSITPEQGQGVVKGPGKGQGKKHPSDHSGANNKNIRVITVSSPSDLRKDSVTSSSVVKPIDHPDLVGGVELIKGTKQKAYANGQHRKSVEIIYSPFGTIETTQIFPKLVPQPGKPGSAQVILPAETTVIPAEKQSVQNILSSTAGNVKGGSWLEEIQFKAHYEHYKVGSFKKLESDKPKKDFKVPTINVEEVEKVSSSSTTNNSSKSSSNSSLHRGTSKTSSVGCWHFPRVSKLSRIFTAKSLDDILGRASPSSTSGSISASVGKGQGQGPKERIRSNSQSAAYSKNYIKNNPGILSASASENNCYRTNNIAVAGDICKTSTKTTKRYLSIPGTDSEACEIEIFRIQRLCQHQQIHEPNSDGTTTTSTSRRNAKALSDNCLNRVFASCSSTGISVDNLQDSEQDLTTTNTEDLPTVLEKITPESSMKKKAELSIFQPKVPSQPTHHHEVTSILKNRNPPSQKSSLKNRIPISKSDSTMSSLPGAKDEKVEKVVVNISFLARPISPFRIESPTGTTGNMSVFQSNQLQSQSATKSDRLRFLQKQKSLGSVNLSSYSGGGESSLIKFRPSNKVAPIAVHFEDNLDHSRYEKKLNINQEGSLAFSTFKSPFLVSEPEDEKDLMMGKDLESPQYVKKTASMFNSRTPTSQTNGSPNGNGIRSPPSYLNVSKSVSGYSCLSYNSTVTEANSNNTANGISLRAKRALNGAKSHSKSFDYAEENQQRHISSINEQLLSSASTSSTPTSRNGRISQRIICGVPSSVVDNRVGPLSGDDDIPYRPGDRNTEGKSFIQQKIERLYGAESVKNGNFWRGSRSRDVSRERGVVEERIIPISIEGKSKSQQQNGNSSSKQEFKLKSSPGEHNLFSGHGHDSSNKKNKVNIIPIQIEEDEEKKLHNNKNASAQIKSNNTINLNNTNNDKQSQREAESSNLNNNQISNNNKNSNGFKPAEAEENDDIQILYKAKVDKNNMDVVDSQINIEKSNNDDLYSTRKTNQLPESPTSSIPVRQEISTTSISCSKKLDDESFCFEGDYDCNTSVELPRECEEHSSSAILDFVNVDSSINTSKINNQDKSLSLSPSGSGLHHEEDTNTNIDELKSDFKITKVEEDNYQEELGQNNLISADSCSELLIPELEVKEQIEAEEGDQSSIAEAESEEKSITMPKPNKSSSSVNKENKPLEKNQFVEKDGAYFIQISNSEKAQIEARIQNANQELEELDQNSERSGKVRAAIGKARLLTVKKFGQFEELCNLNLKEKDQADPDKPFQTKNDDLAGFWDMVLIQVDQIYEMFDELEGIVRNTEKASTTSLSKSSASPKKDPLKKISTTVPQQKKSSSREKDESRKRLLAEKRKAMKGNISNANADAEVQIFIPEPITPDTEENDE